MTALAKRDPNIFRNFPWKVITKRDGTTVKWNSSKIADAIFKAASSVGGCDRGTAEDLVLDVMSTLKNEYADQAKITVENVQDVVENVLIETGHAKTAKAYIRYRDDRTRTREAKHTLFDAVAKIHAEHSRDNANMSGGPSTEMYQTGSEASKMYYLARVIPEKFAKAHIDGDIHVHDLDYYDRTLNCINLPLGKLLKSGFNNGHGYIRPPKRPGSATALSCIAVQSSQNDMFGGQSVGFFDRDMAPYMENASEQECFQAMEALVYNLNSMHSRAGNQVPFSSLNIGTDTSVGGRKTIKYLLLAFEKGLGRGENPIFPNIIFRVKAGINMNPGDPNYDLFQLAIRVAAKRLNPTFSFMDSSFNKPYGNEVAYMGCRTRVISNRHGEEVTDGRGNLSFTTINLPRLAILAQKDVKAFYESLENMIDNIVIPQLMHRYERQAARKAKQIPFLFGQHLYMGSEKLGPEDPIKEAIKNGTISVGFIGLAECLIALIGKHHGESPEAQELGEQIVAFMRKKCDRASEKLDMNVTFIATPAEGLSGRFTALDLKKFGSIPRVNDHEFYTNSFHVPVWHEISIFDKIKIEGVYHKYTNAGHISYVEFDAPPINNLGAIEDIIRHMQKCDFGYAGINFPIDFCEECGYLGVIDDNCPSCGGNSSISRVRRITGYLSTVDKFNDAKRAELKNRFQHMKVR